MALRLVEALSGTGNNKSGDGVGRGVEEQSDGSGEDGEEGRGRDRDEWRNTE